jgi:nucleoside phosphorylase
MWQGDRACEWGTWSVGIIEVGEGNVTSGSATTDVLAKFTPKLIAFSGIAGSRKADVPVGSVVVPEQVDFYPSGKEFAKRTASRARVAHASKQLTQIARELRQDQTWTKLLPPRSQSEDPPEVFVKPLASGELVVVTTRGPTEKLLRIAHDDTQAVETEGYGFLNAASERVPAVVVRGISDRRKKGHSGERSDQRLAAERAAAMTVAIAEVFLKPRHRHPPGPRPDRSEHGLRKQRVRDFLALLDGSHVLYEEVNVEDPAGACQSLDRIRAGTTALVAILRDRDLEDAKSIREASREASLAIREGRTQAHAIQTGDTFADALNAFRDEIREPVARLCSVYEFSPIPKITTFRSGFPGPGVRIRVASRATAQVAAAPFPESKQFRAYAQQLKAERDVAVRRAEDSEASPEAQLVVKAEFLVQAMRALEDGYRKIFSALLGFDERWAAKRRQQAKSDLDEWLDRRILVPMITQWSAELDHSATNNRFFADAVDPLLGLKRLHGVRQDLARALEQGKDHEFVTTWAKRVLNQVDEGAPALEEADTALGVLRASVFANRKPSPAEPSRNRVATTQSSEKSVELQEFRAQVAELQGLRRDGDDLQRRLREGQDIRILEALIRSWLRRARNLIDGSPQLTLDQKRKVPILSQTRVRPDADELARVVQDTLKLLPESKP